MTGPTQRWQRWCAYDAKFVKVIENRDTDLVERCTDVYHNEVVKVLGNLNEFAHVLGFDLNDFFERGWRWDEVELGAEVLHHAVEQRLVKPF